jgi:phospholipid-binding lipoprotein MlaA
MIDTKTKLTAIGCFAASLAFSTSPGLSPSKTPSISTVVLPGVASESHGDDDPLRTMNEVFDSFNNEFLRFLILKPITDAYTTILPNEIQKGIAHACDNIYEPLSAANYLLQGEGEKFTQSLVRFLLNSTFGLLGLIDAASYMGVKPLRQTTIGLTLGKWGVDRGPYLVLPFVGPTTIRGAIGTAGEWFANPLRVLLLQRHHYPKHEWMVYTQTGLNAINTEKRMGHILDDLQKKSKDFYKSVREMYYQNLMFKEQH